MAENKVYKQIKLDKKKTNDQTKKGREIKQSKTGYETNKAKQELKQINKDKN